jgi:hypothetical protein
MGSHIDRPQLERYRRDGVICLRQAFAPRWLALARRGIERSLGSPGPFFRDHTRAGSSGRYLFDFWNWRRVPEFERLIFESPLGEIGAGILDRERVLMLMDNWFMQEAGATSGAPWHHDEPYFDFEGAMCIVWIPLESVSADQGLTFVAGSHDWGRLFVAEQFSENVPFDGGGGGYETMPDFGDGDGQYRFVSWDLDPGDCLVFDFRTIHRASQISAIARETTHRMTFRLGGDDVLFRPRGSWTQEITDHLVALGQMRGGVIDNPLNPEIWDTRRASDSIPGPR